MVASLTIIVNGHGGIIPPKYEMKNVYSSFVSALRTGPQLGSQNYYFLQFYSQANCYLLK